MAKKPFTGGQYKPLTEADVGKIHESALTLLEKGVVRVYTKTGLDAFREDFPGVGGSNGRTGPFHL